MELSSGSEHTFLPHWASISASKALKIAIASWVAVALAGQWMFACYISIRYAIPIVQGDIESVNLGTHITGYVAGDTLGNLAYFSHLIPAALLSVGGILQLLPWIRKNYPLIHRWNGRMFMTLGLMGAISGLYLTWGRGSRLSDLGAIGITLNGLLIPVAIYFAWRYAITKRFDLHKRFAVHAFLLVNGVWTFRLYLMAWFIINQGANGNNDTLDGPADLAISFACYALPMLIAELVFWAQRQQANSKKWGVTFIMSVGCLLTLTGVIAATMFMWLPVINSALSSQS